MKDLTVFNKEVIPVYVTDTGEKIVVGRELHESLNISSKYADWFKNMCAYGFSEDIDYSAFSENLENGGRRIEHYIKLDMAKHIAMIQRTPEGKAIRQKLIELEKYFQQKTLAPRKRSKPIDLFFRQQFSMAKTLSQHTGIKKDIAYAHAIAETEKKFGVNLGGYAALLPARTDTEPVTGMNATDVGARIGKSAVSTNKLLEAMGLQQKVGKHWRLTETGRTYAEEFPFERNGHTDVQVRWNESVIPVLIESDACNPKNERRQ